MIIQYITRKMIPFIQLYALYVIAHGDLGPGGGFQGGVIFGTSLILYIIVFGLERGKRLFKLKVFDFLGALGVLIYTIVGLLCIYFDGTLLEYTKLPFSDPHLSAHLGIFAIEVGVAITVSAVMVVFIFDIARKKDV
ncbi:MAG: Na(+)/H(+) antiporter subunit B [Proteobacteria bacterium]|nr:Na(+)/H(+) antiporter subunit B [Pseudomonadota bacterium]